MRFPISENELIKFQKSNTKNKKYDAIIENKQTGKQYTIPFGDVRYEQYKDSTGLELYKNLNHYDEVRKSHYKIRHANTFNKYYFSPSYFSWKYLW